MLGEGVTDAAWYAAAGECLRDDISVRARQRGVNIRLHREKKKREEESGRGKQTSKSDVSRRKKTSAATKQTRPRRRGEKSRISSLLFSPPFHFLRRRRRRRRRTLSPQIDSVGSVALLLACSASRIRSPCDVTGSAGPIMSSGSKGGIEGTATQYHWGFSKKENGGVSVR